MQCPMSVGVAGLAHRDVPAHVEAPGRPPPRRAIPGITSSRRPQLGPALRAPLREQFGVVRPRRGGREAVHPDAVRGQVHRGGADEVGQPALVRRVGDEPGRALPRVRGQDRHDRPLIPRSIMASAPCLVNRKLPLTAIVIARLNEARSSSRSPHACSQAALLITMSIRSQACSTAPMFASTSASTLTSPDSASADTAVALDPPHRRLGRVEVQVVARHPRPVPRQRQRDPAPDVRPRPGDQRHLPVQRYVHGSPSGLLPKRALLREVPHALMTTVLIWV